VVQLTTRRRCGPSGAPRNPDSVTLRNNNRIENNRHLERLKRKNETNLGRCSQLFDGWRLGKDELIYDVKVVNRPRLRYLFMDGPNFSLSIEHA